MTTILKPPHIGTYGQYEKTTIFLAGSIDMGSAVDWQTRVADSLSDYNVTIFNPRRDDWDSSWVQSIDNPQFNQQVSWELEHLEEADLILFYFDPNGPAPITLLELGLFVGMQSNIIVCCPEGYWRKGNVDIICQRYGQSNILQVDNLDELIHTAKQWLIERI